MRGLCGRDATRVLTIFQTGLETGDASFETAARPGRLLWASFVLHRAVWPSPSAEEIAPWVAASAVSPRAVYRGVIEHSVYVHPDAQGQGIGLALLEALTGSADAAGIWTIQTGIFPETTPAVGPPARRVRAGRHPAARRPCAVPELAHWL